MKLFRTLSTLAVGTAIALLAPAAAADTCTADVSAEQRTDLTSNEAITKSWAVEVVTEADCAKVYVDAEITERLFNGEVITSKQRGWRKVTTKTSTYKVIYRIPLDSTLTDWKFTVASCVPCGSN